MNKLQIRQIWLMNKLPQINPDDTLALCLIMSTYKIRQSFNTAGEYLVKRT